MDLGSAHAKTKSAHVWRGGEIAQLSSIVPGSIGYRLYLHKPTQLHFLETFRGTSPPPRPFSGLLPAVDIPLDLPRELSVITKVYEHLKKSGRAHGIKRSYMNFSRMLSETMRSACLAFVVDDQTTDFACICEYGRLSHFRTRCADMTLAFAGGKAHIEPWAPPGDEHPHMYLMMPSRRSLQAALPEVEIAVKIPWPEDARHVNALVLWSEFSSGAAAPIGLGDWDFSFNEGDFDLLTKRP